MIEFGIKDFLDILLVVEYISLRKEMTVADAILKIRQVGINRETIYTCYVTEKRKLIGVVDVKDLLTAGESRLIEELSGQSGARRRSARARRAHARRRALAEKPNLARHSPLEHASHCSRIRASMPHQHVGTLPKRCNLHHRHGQPASRGGRYFREWYVTILK